MFLSCFNSLLTWIHLKIHGEEPDLIVQWMQINYILWMSWSKKFMARDTWALWEMGGEGSCWNSLQSLYRSRAWSNVQHLQQGMILYRQPNSKNIKYPSLPTAYRKTTYDMSVTLSNLLRSIWRCSCSSGHVQEIVVIS